MNIKRSGGIRPQSSERITESGFWNAAVPSVCVVPLQQHAGSRVEPTVSVGDVVREGMPIGRAGGRLGVPVHAPIPGRVSQVGETILADGTRSRAIAIELSGEFDRLGRALSRRDWSSDSPDDVRERIRDAGVVSTGRTALPAHVLLQVSRGSPPPRLVLDIAETEPYLTADAELVAVSAETVLEGLRIAARALDTSDLHAVVSRGHARAGRAIRRVAGSSPLRIHTVTHRYPANLPEQLRRATGDRGSDVQQVVVTPSTVHAIYEAVVYGKPHIDRIVSVGGAAAVRPAHIRVHVGTAIGEVFAECGGLREAPARIVVGGALTGLHVATINTPITKTTAAVLALTEDEIRAGEEQPCIGCGACARACPVALNPMLLNNLILEGRDAQADAAGLMDCTECGLCAHVCPSRIPLVARFAGAKRGVA